MKKLTVLVAILTFLTLVGCSNVKKENSDKVSKVTTSQAITTKSSINTTNQAITTTEGSLKVENTTEQSIKSDEKSTVGAIVIVGDEIITEKDIEDEFEDLPDQYKPYYMSQEGKKRLLKNLINQKLLKIVAIKESIDKTEDYKKD
ncbi:MAG: hypothetical protein QW757_06135, partial [Candidatus Woesearchaeota archaeon]